MSGKKGLFLDLDGTLVRAFPAGDTTRGPRSRDEVEILPGTAEASKAARRAGYVLICITNQPDLARKAIDPTAHLGVRLLVREQLPQLTRIYVCPHDGNWCACRKPRPGLLFVAAWAWGLDLSRCWSIGDRETDREAAIRAGIPQSQAILLPTNHGIAEAVQHILEHENEQF